jgi:hypothetical protein
MLDSQTDPAFATLLRALRKSSLPRYSRFVVRLREHGSAFHGFAWRFPTSRCIHGTAS